MHAIHTMQTLIFFFILSHTQISFRSAIGIVRINPNPNAMINTIFECFVKQVIKINDITSMNLMASIHFKCWFWCNFRFKRPILLHFMPVNSSFFAYSLDDIKKDCSDFNWILYFCVENFSFAWSFLRNCAWGHLLPIVILHSKCSFSDAFGDLKCVSMCSYQPVFMPLNLIRYLTLDLMVSLKSIIAIKCIQTMRQHSNEVWSWAMLLLLLLQLMLMLSTTENYP